MRTSVGIIGMGWVGTSVAISTLHAGFAGELLLNDVRGEVAEGEAMDLAHGAAFYPAARVRTAAIDEMKGCDAVVIAAGRGGAASRTSRGWTCCATMLRSCGRSASGCATRRGCWWW